MASLFQENPPFTPHPWEVQELEDIHQAEVVVEVSSLDVQIWVVAVRLALLQQAQLTAF